MNKVEAAEIIIGIIPENRWSSFTDWAEGLRGCDHEQSSYTPWLAKNGSANPAGESQRLYDAMGVYAGTGPCACAAGQGLFGYPSTTPVTRPLRDCVRDMRTSQDGEVETKELYDEAMASIAAGAALDARDFKGRSALLFALDKCVDRGAPFDLIHALIDAGANPNAADDEGATALFYLARARGSKYDDPVANSQLLAVAKALVSKGAEVNAAAHSPLAAAGKIGRPELALFLLSEGADPNGIADGMPAIVSCVSSTDRVGLAIVDALIDAGADLERECTNDRMTAALNALLFDRPDTFVRLIAAGAKLDPKLVGRNGSYLHLLVQRGRLDLVRELLEQGADIDAVDHEGRTPLHVAVKQNDAEAIALLLESGASAKAKTKTRVTPIMLAAEHGNATVVRRLLEAKADPNVRDSKGVSALSLAVQGGHADAVLALLEHDKIKADDPDRAKTTPLMHAVAAETVDMTIVRALLDGGADANAANKNGVSTLSFACTGNLDMKALAALLAAGGDPNVADKTGSTPLHRMARRKHEEACRALVAAGADTAAKDKRGKRPIDLVRDPSPEMTALLG